MNPLQSRLALRARDPLTSLDAAIVLARSLGMVVPQLFALTILPWCVVLGGWVAWAPTSVLPWVVATAVYPLLQLPALELGATALFGEVPSAGRVVMRGLARLDVMMTLWVRGIVWAVTSVMCLGLPTVFLVPSTFWLAETVALEKRGIGPAIERAGRLSVSAPGHVLTACGVALFGPMIAVVAAESTGQALVSTVLQLGQPFGSLWDGTLTPWAMAGSLLAAPIVAWFRLILYLDSRTRIEGWDLQVAIDGIVSPGSTR